MKTLIRWCFLHLLVCLLCCPAYAAVYTDNMTDFAGGTIKTYSGLANFPMDDAVYASLPDRTAFTFASTQSPCGWVIYRAREARQITVGIYSNNGTFISRLNDGSGKYALGLHTGDASLFAGKQLPQASFSPSAKAVYAILDGAYLKAHAADTHYEFAAGTNPGDLIGYGVNVLVSADGREFRRVNLTQSSLHYRSGDALCYEELTGTVPAGVEYIRVELNDVGQFPLLSAPDRYEHKAPKRFNCLASVTLSGENLSLGPAFVQEQNESSSSPESDPSAPSASSSRASSSRRAATVQTYKAASTACTKSPSSAQSISKFEGVIEKSASSKKTSAKASSSVAASKFSQQDQPESVAEAESPPSVAVEEVVQLVEVPQSDDGDRVMSGIVVYIIIVLAALLFVLTNGRKRS